MQTMSPAEYQAFMLNPVRTAKLATVREDGRPHLAPIWFILDNDDFLFTTWHSTVKAANLRFSPRVSICVDDDKPPFAFVIVEGIAQVDENPDPTVMLRWTIAIAARYMGADLAEAYGQRNAVAGEWLIRVKPTKVIAKTGIAD